MYTQQGHQVYARPNHSSVLKAQSDQRRRALYGFSVLCAVTFTVVQILLHVAV